MSEVDYRSKCIREKGDVCFRCEGERGNSSGVVVHHIDENRENDQIDNLAPLCRSCHIIWHKNNLWDGGFQEFLRSWPDPRVTGDRPARPARDERVNDYANVNEISYSEAHREVIELGLELLEIGDGQEAAMTGEGRALLTDRERDVLTGEADANINYEYKVKSLVRNRLRKRLGQDIEILEEHFEEGYEMIHEEVCDDEI